MMRAWRLPLAFLRSDARRTALSVVAVACGTALVCAVSLGSRAVEGSLFEMIDTLAGRASLEVAAGDGAVFPESVVATVASVAGVQLATPVVTGVAFPADGSGELLTVYGVDLGNETAVRSYDARTSRDEVIDDPLVFLSQPDSVVVTRAFAAARGLARDDTIALDTPLGVRRFVIRGLLEPTGVGAAFAGKLVVMDVYAAAEVFARRGFINRVDVIVARDADLDAIAAAIGAVLPPGLAVHRPEQRRVDLQAVMRSIRVMLLAASLVGLLAAFLIVFNRMSSVFERRLWQIGVLRATGLRAGTVRALLLRESLLTGALGVLLGVPLGIGLGRLLLPIIATTTSLAAKTIVTPGEFAVDPLVIAGAAVLGLAAAALAAIVPARRASAVAIAAVVRGRGVELQTPPARARGALPILLALLAGGAVLAQAVTRVAEFGLAATVLIAALAVALAPLAVALAQRPVAAALVALWGATGRLAAATLLRNPRHSALAMATLAVGLGAVFWLFLLAASFERTLGAVMPGVLRGDLAVGSTNVALGFVEMPLDESVVTEIARLPGVAAAAGERALDWRFENEVIALNAFDGAYFGDPVHGAWTLLAAEPDALARVARGAGVLASTNFVLHTRHGLGDEIELATPTGPLRLPIVGLVTDFLSPRGTLELSRDLLRSRWGDGTVIRVLVRVEDGVPVEQVRATIAERLGRTHALRILSQRELMAHLGDQVRRAFTPIHALGAVFLLVVLIGMIDTLTANVVERTGELGVVRAVGVGRGAIVRMVLIEGLVLGVLGLALALVLGTTIGVLWVHATFPALLGWMIELHVPWREFALFAVLSVVTCAGAAWLAGRAAARLRPALAVRWE